MPEMQPFIPLRPCGHPATLENSWYELYNDKTIIVYCLGCIIDIMKKHYGLKPVETLTAQEFAKKYFSGAFKEGK